METLLTLSMIAGSYERAVAVSRRLLVTPDKDLSTGTPTGLKGLGLIHDLGVWVAIPGLKIETWGIRRHPENFGSSSFSQETCWGEKP
jgi:hypothetical protein